MGEGSLLAKARPLVLARAYSAAVTFAIPLVLARLLSLPEYGTFKQFFLLSTTLYLVLALGMPQSLFYFLPRAREDEARTWLSQTLLWLSGAGALVAAILCGAGPLLARFGGEALASQAVPLALATGCLLGAYGLESGLTASGRARSAAISFAASDTAKTIAFVGPALLGMGLSGVLWGAASFSALRLAAAWAIHGRVGRSPRLRAPMLRAQLRYALPFGAAILLAIPQQQFHQYVVAAATSPAVFAIYAVGCFNLPIVDLLYSPTSELLMHRIGEMEKEGRPAREAAAAFREASGQLAYAFLPIAAGLFAVAPAFITVLYGERFAGAAPIFRIALVVVLVACFPVDGVLRARARTRALFVSYALKAALSVPLVLGLFRALGPIGAMAGFALAELGHKGALLLLAARALLPGTPTLAALREVVAGRHFARAGLAASGAAALALVADGLLPLEPLLALPVFGGGFWLVYFAALVAAGVRPSALLAALRPRG